VSADEELELLDLQFMLSTYPGFDRDRRLRYAELIGEILSRRNQPKVVATMREGNGYAVVRYSDGTEERMYSAAWIDGPED
jgi:hypothetical protein